MVPQRQQSTSKQRGPFRSQLLCGLRSLNRLLPPLVLLLGLVALALLSFSWRPDDLPGNPALASTSTAAGTQGHSIHTAGAGGLSGKHVDQPLKLLIASHSRLFWFYPSTGAVKVLHEAQGVHYGMFPGKGAGTGRLEGVWFALRPHNWHPQTSEEFLVECDADTGHELSRHRVLSRFTHDVVRSGSRVLLCSTESGEVVELSYPDMKEVRRMALFTKTQHVNTLAPLEEGSFWALLHNLGTSKLVRVSAPTGGEPAVVETIHKVGRKAHGIVEWREWLILLDSEGGALVRVRVSGGGAKDARAVETVYQVPEGRGKFLKGLCVLGNVAYFGINKAGPRKLRDDPTADADVAAVDLTTGKLLWRKQVPSRGLLNSIGAPHLSESSTYKAVQLPTATTTTTTTSTSSTVSEVQGRSEGGQQGAEFVSGITDPAVLEVTKKLHALGFPPLIGGQWPTKLPYLDLETKRGSSSWEAGIQLPLTTVDVTELKALMNTIPAEMWTDDYQKLHNAAVAGRDANMNKFKPGVGAMYLMFSDRTIQNAYIYPYYEQFQKVLDPILHKIIGEQSMRKIVRLQFALMPPKTVIHIHRDMGGYAAFAHRIHLPVITHSDMVFEVCPGLEKRAHHVRTEITDAHVSRHDDCVVLPMGEGMVFELNNRLLHRVFNHSPDKIRIQLVVDVAEVDKPTYKLEPGTQCQYVKGVVECPPGTMTQVA